MINQIIYPLVETIFEELYNESNDSSFNQLFVKKVDENAIVPEFATQDSAGLDLTAIDFDVKDNNIVLFDTGLQLAIPKNYFGGIYPRSGLSLKGEWIIANNVGVIDSDYRGNIKVMMRFLGDPNYIMNESLKLLNTRVAQIIIQPFIQPKIKLCSKLKKTERGDGGFGSTGK